MCMSQLSFDTPYIQNHVDCPCALNTRMCAHVPDHVCCMCLPICAPCACQYVPHALGQLCPMHDMCIMLVMDAAHECLWAQYHFVQYSPGILVCTGPPCCPLCRSWRCPSPCCVAAPCPAFAVACCALRVYPVALPCCGLLTCPLTLDGTAVSASSLNLFQGHATVTVTGAKFSKKQWSRSRQS